MSKRRVVITGMGIVSCVGSQLDEAWGNILEGNSGIVPIDEFDASALATRIGGTVKGFDVSEADHGLSAFEALEDQDRPDLVLVDWNMPIMNGIDFLRELRKTTSDKRPLVIFCTTENNMSHIREAMEAGADEYIMKPFDREIIEAKFTQVGLL